MASNKVLVDIVSDNGSFRLNMSKSDFPKTKDLLTFSDGDYVVTKVYRFKKIRMFLVRLVFNVSFYEIKKFKDGK